MYDETSNGMDADSCDVVFVTPGFEDDSENESIGTLILAKLLGDAGIPCRIIRFWQAVGPLVGDALHSYSAFEDALVELILASSPRIVSFYTREDTHHIMYRLAERLKQARPEAFMILGGPQASVVPRETLLAFPQVDFILCGEGESTVVPFFRSLLAGKANYGIAGLAYRAAGDVTVNPLPEMLPQGYASDHHIYDIIPRQILDKSSDMQIDVGRGCPFTCTFCSTKTFWQRKFRLRDINDILDEIEYLQHRYGIKSFTFDHDLFTANKGKVLEFCSAIEARGMKFRWTCSTRLDTIDEEMVVRMQEVGLTGLFFGIETGSQRMQQVIKKNLALDKLLPFARFLSTRKLDCTFSFIYGFPEEAMEDVADTMAAIMALFDIGFERVQLHELWLEDGAELLGRYHEVCTWDPSEAEIVQSFGARESLEMMRAHPYLFPQYYKLPASVCRQLPYAADFLRCYKRTPKSMRYALDEVFGSDVLAMCHAFEKACTGLLESSFDRPDYMTRRTSAWVPLNIAMLEAFFSTLADAPYGATLLDLNAFERKLLLKTWFPDAGPGSKLGGQPDEGREYLFDWDAAKAHAPLPVVSQKTTYLRLVCRNGHIYARFTRPEDDA